MVLMRVHFLVTVLLVTVGTALGQNETVPNKLFTPYTNEVIVLDTDTPNVDTVMAVLPMRPGSLSYTISPEIDRLMRDYVSRKHIRRGFRVQIFLGERAEAENTKRSFLQRYPDTSAYLSWLAPNFKLRVGDFITRLEAEKMLHELRGAYPGSYIVPDEVEMRKL